MDEWQAFGNVQSAASAEYSLRNTSVAFIPISAEQHRLGI